MSTAASIISADVKGQRLFMAALGNHTVEVMDVQGGKRLDEVLTTDRRLPQERITNSSG
jgi:hypothetical protein